jgi:hypothetical protein
MMHVYVVERMKGEISSDDAITFARLKWWLGLDPRAVFEAQINQSLLCMDFSAFHKATEDALGRPVWSHEFACPDALIEEFKGQCEKGNAFGEAMKLIGTGKTIAVVTDNEGVG